MMKIVTRMMLFTGMLEVILSSRLPSAQSPVPIVTADRIDAIGGKYDPYENQVDATDGLLNREITHFFRDPALLSSIDSLSIRDRVSQYGITWIFEGSVRVGQFINGDWYVVGPVTIKAIDPRPLYGSEIPEQELDRIDKERPQPRRVRNGFMLNPPAAMKVAYDSGVRNWFDPSLIQQLPISLKPGDSLVSTISMPKNWKLKAQLRNEIERGVDDSSPIRTAAVLTCVTEPQPRDAFRPAFCDRKQTIYLARNLKRELLPKVTATPGMPKTDQYIRFTQRPWVGTGFFGFEEPVENMPQYGLEYGRVVGIAALMLCTDLSPERKEPLLINFVQVGIDLGGMIRAGHPGWTGWGGHGSGRKLPIVFAGLLLGDDELANINCSFPKASFGEDEQTAYGDSWTGAKVVFAGHSGIDAATGKGRSRDNGWGPYEHTPPTEWKDGANTSESYRRCCTSVGWVAQALALRLMGAEKNWHHDPFFDYVDRWMFEDDAQFIKTIQEATGRDHDKEWARQGQAWDRFVNEMWTMHRPQCAAPTNGWKQQHDDFYYRKAIGDPRAGAVSLPARVKAIWDLNKAHQEATETRARICINGLWLWQPAETKSAAVPENNWGYFKVPGCWPGITDYMQKDCQIVFSHPAWKDRKLGQISAAWYERSISIPVEWVGRKIDLSLQVLNSFADVFIDGKKAGDICFPGGLLDLSEVCKPGQTHRLSILVTAMPLKGVMLSYTDSASAREVKGSVARRGLCGDVYLISGPKGARIADVRISTSFRTKQLSLDTAIEALSENVRYDIRMKILKNGHLFQEFTSPGFHAGDLKNGRINTIQSWMPDTLWDIHTPHNTFHLEVILEDLAGQVLDAVLPQRFGFREMWIDGRDFYLNGTRIYLSAVPFDNAQIGAAWANYEAACESFRRLKSFGINFVYTHNYDCLPGSHLGFEQILRAADDVGILVSFSQPHFSHYDWQPPDADQQNGYARHAESYVRMAGNHPSVVMYSMSHNATGYNEDMNPDLIDGLQEMRDSWALRNAQSALRAEAIVRKLDPSRIVYHHASGNLGSMIPINFYLNWVPIQELSDWFEHWSLQGVKPVFLCEYGVPFTWDWTMYRGWYNGRREFGSARVPWEFCLAEWNAQFVGDAAFKISEYEKTNLRWEARQFKAGNLWYRWDYPYQVGSPQFEERYPIFARYITDNWRAFRTWGVSATSPWEYGHFWKIREGVDRGRRELKVDWDMLQRPDFSPDYIDQRYERMDIAYEATDWIATEAAQALIRNNSNLLAYIAGKPERFTGKDHNFLPGQVVEKQIILLNNSRISIDCEVQWSLNLPQAQSGNQKIPIATGQQKRIPLRFDLPNTLSPGRYELHAKIQFSNGQTQTDRFSIDVLPPPPAMQIGATIAVFDPEGQTKLLLDKLGFGGTSITAKDDMSAYDLLIVGRKALTVDGAVPNIGRVRDGMKVIVFEQSSEVLEKRLGFRVQEYGLRQVFARLSDVPTKTGISSEQIHDWNGEATLLPPRLKYTMDSKFNGAPWITWCGIPVTRAWRCGNQGTVASVLIEKPTRGDFLPILDGGYALQYSPLLAFREGRGLILFCQLDVSGRTESDPAAEMLVGRFFEYVLGIKPIRRLQTIYIGEDQGRDWFDKAGFFPASLGSATLTPDHILVVGPGGGSLLANRAAEVSEWIRSGGHVLAVGLDQTEIGDWLPVKITTQKREHITACLDPFGSGSWWAGISGADVHNRDPRETPLIVSGANPVGKGILAKVEGFNVVFCQLAPWQFDGSKQMNLKRTARRLSFLVSRLLGNMGAAVSTPLLDHFSRPVDIQAEKRWLEGLYLDKPEEWDDPYRFFRW